MDYSGGSELNETEILLASYYYLYSDKEEDNYWKYDSKDDVSVMPLYDEEETITAYYVKTKTGYVILHNDIMNPVAMEFGEGECDAIEAIAEKKDAEKIVYTGPLQVYGSEEYCKMQNKTSIYDNYPVLKEHNEQLSQLLKNTENMIKESSRTLSQSETLWGFFENNILPVGEYIGRNLGSCTTTEWVKMQFFNDYNHCGPTAAVNILKWFYKREYSNVYRGSNIATYNGVKSYLVRFPMIGATASLRSGLTNYCSAWGYTLNSSQVNTFAQLKTAINYNRICDMLIRRNSELHWIVVIGYRDYTDDSYQYLRVINGWNENSNVYYIVGQGSSKTGSTCYWIR